MYVIVDQSVACIYSVLVSVLANLYAFLLFIRLLSCVITGSSHFSVKTGRCSEKENRVSYTPDTRSRNQRQKPAPENWRRFLECLSYNLVPNFSGARFWSLIEHVLFRDRIWRPRDQNTDL